MKKNLIIVVLILLTISGVAQTGIIKGKVLSTDGLPAAYVNITIPELNRGSVTSEEGSFILRNLKVGSYRINISHSGLQAQEKDIVIESGKTQEINFTLGESASELEEVVIDGNKSMNRPVSIGKAPIGAMDLPQSVSIIGSGIIRDQQAQRLSDVVKNVNGVYLAATRAGTQETFSARGYGLSNFNMFKNGSRVNTGAMPEMSSLEKVEILKGSAAILYGQVAPGAVLNLVTKQPKFHFGGEVSMRLGSYDLYKPAVDIYGPISKNAAFRINGMFETANSFRDNVSSKRYYVNPSLLFKLGKKTELLVQGDYLKHEFTPDFGIGSIGDTVINDVPRNTFFGAPWQYAKTEQATSGLSLKHAFNDKWTLNAAVSFQNYRRDYFSLERIQAKASGDWSRPLGRTKNNENYYSAQFDLTGKFNTGRMEHTLLAGIDADKYHTTNWTYDQQGKIYDVINVLDPGKYIPRTDMPVAKQTGRTEAPVNRMGAYIQDLVKLSANFNLLAGIRFSYLENTAKAAAWTYEDNTHTPGTQKYESAISPRLGLVYKPFTVTSLFASYSNSFAPNSGLDIDGNGLKPSIIDQFEAGVKNEFFNGLLSANLTIYRIINNNLAQTAQFNALGQPNNDATLKALVGETTSDGIEVDIAGHPFRGMDILAGYSYNDMRVTKSPGTKGSYYVGDRLVQNPHHTANASLYYTFQDFHIKGLKLGASVYYIGKRSAGWNNTVGQTQGDNFNRLIPVGAFTTLDISAGYTYGQMSFMAKVSNLANTYNYYVHENYSVNPIAPRQFIATLAYRLK